MIELDVVGSARPAMVDECFAHLARYRWKLDKDGYVHRKAGGKRIYLHHVVLPGDRYPEFVRDHRNRDKLNNRADNLRWLTLTESVQNRDACRKNTTGQRGVMPIGKRFRATVTVEGRTHRLGMFDDPVTAGRAASALRHRIMPFSADAEAA
jgi:hypothetical protein